jgi:hypothetical protein
MRVRWCKHWLVLVESPATAVDAADLTTPLFPSTVTTWSPEPQMVTRSPDSPSSFVCLRGRLMSMGVVAGLESYYLVQ